MSRRAAIITGFTQITYALVAEQDYPDTSVVNTDPNHPEVRST